MANDYHGRYREKNWYKNRVQERKRMDRRLKAWRRYQEEHETPEERRRRKVFTAWDTLRHYLLVLFVVFGCIVLMYIFGTQILIILRRLFA